MLERLFTSKTRIRILTLFIFNQDIQYHLRQIARLINTSPIYTAKELDNLAKLNIIKKSKKANLSIYSLNKSCVFLSELKSLFMKTDFLGELIKKEIKIKLNYCFIYGSFAQGTESELSDIDLFFVSNIKEDEIIKLIQHLEGVAKREINYVLWDEKSFIQKSSKGNHLLRSINKKKIIMLIGDEDEFRRQIK